MAEHKPGASYTVVDLAEVSRDDPARLNVLLRQIHDDAKKGALPPLPMRVFPLADVADAFRHMAQAKHIGKVVVSLPVKEQAALVSRPIDRSTFLPRRPT